MAQVTASIPQVSTDYGTTGVGSVGSAPAVGTILDGDLLVQVSGGVSSAGTNVAGSIVGFAIHNSAANFGGSINTQPGPTFSFGFTQEGDPGYPLDASLQKYEKILNAEPAMNLAADCGWISGGTQQANVGTAFGILIDPATGYPVADPSQTNKVGIITEKIEGPSAGTVGDTGSRVSVSFYPSVLVAQ